MGRKKHIFDSEESEWEEGKEPDELEEIDLESGTKENSLSPDSGDIGRKDGPKPLKLWAIMLIFLGLSILSAVISVILWYFGQAG